MQGVESGSGNGLTDEHVVLASRGDAEALGALLERYAGRIKLRLTIDSVWQSFLDVEDVMQVTYLESFLRMRELRARNLEQFEAWLARVAENNLRDALRELRRAKRPDPHRRVTRGPDDESHSRLLETIAATSHTASKSAAGRESRALVLAAVRQLPESYRKVVEFFDLEEQSPAEVAQALGRSTGAVFMLRARAHDRLRDLLGSSSRYYFGDSA